MKRFVRCVSFLLVLVMLMTTTAFAAAPVQRASYFFSTHSVYMWKTTGKTFQIWFEVTGTGMMDEIGASKIVLECSTDGENWSDLKTYKMANYSQMIDEDSVGHTGCVSYTGATGYYYRALVTLYAKNSSGTGQYSVYTDTIKY